MDRFLLRIDPPQSCMGSNGEGPCPLLTTLAEAEHESENELQLRVYPYCAQHLFIGFPDPTPEELELEHFCITNFVVNHFGGQGTAAVLGECPVDNIPAPYEAWEDIEDEAWYIVYHNEQGKAQRGVAVFLTWESWWEWYEFSAPGKIRC